MHAVLTELYSAAAADGVAVPTTIRLLPLPTVGATVTASQPPPPFPLPDDSTMNPGSIIDADLHFLPVQQLPSLGSSDSGSGSGSGSGSDYYSNNITTVP